MADHKAEQILDAFTALVTGLTTTGSNVLRDRDYDLEKDINAALSIYQGADTPVPNQDDNWSYIDSLLDIRVRILVKASTGTPVSQQLNLIRKEIAVAVLAVTNLSLAFVIGIEEGPADEPIIEHTEKPLAAQDCKWSVLYRRSRTDPSA